MIREFSLSKVMMGVAVASALLVAVFFSAHSFTSLAEEISKEEQEKNATAETQASLDTIQKDEKLRDLLMTAAKEEDIKAVTELLISNGAPKEVSITSIEDIGDVSSDLTWWVDCHLTAEGIDCTVHIAF